MMLPIGAQPMPRCSKDAERLIVAWNERQAKRKPIAVLANDRRLDRGVPGE
jgi:hypothetical protein